MAWPWLDFLSIKCPFLAESSIEPSAKDGLGSMIQSPLFDCCSMSRLPCCLGMYYAQLFEISLSVFDEALCLIFYAT
jgi:hypothetical protein